MQFANGVDNSASYLRTRFGSEQLICGATLHFPLKPHLERGDDPDGFWNGNAISAFGLKSCIPDGLLQTECFIPGTASPGFAQQSDKFLWPARTMHFEVVFDDASAARLVADQSNIFEPEFAISREFRQAPLEFFPRCVLVECPGKARQILVELRGCFA